VRNPIHFKETAVKDVSLQPKYIRELADLEASFPLRLWFGAVLAACVLTWAFAIPAAEDATSVEAYPLPAAETPTGEPGLTGVEKTTTAVPAT
jgi:hypothetical protein